MPTDTPHRYTRYLIGATLIGLGATLLLDEQRIVALQDIWQYWPLLLVVGGAIRMIDPEKPGDVMRGCWTLFIGLWLFANVEGWLGIDFGNSWPCLLIGWGVLLLLRPVFSANRQAVKQNTDAR